MKKTFMFALAMIFTLSSAMAAASNSNVNTDPEKTTVPVKTENRLSEAELSRLTNRVEEIRNMDKSGMSSTEKKELKKELKQIKKTVKRRGGAIYISGATLVLIIILVILLV